MPVAQGCEGIREIGLLPIFFVYREEGDYEKIRFVWRYVRPYRYQFVLILLDVAVYSLFMLAAPLIISWMIDNVIKGVPFDNAFLQQLVDMAGGMEALQSHLWIGSALVVGSYLMVAFAINRRSMHAGNVAETLALNVRNDLYDHLQKLPFSYHKSRDSGDLIQRSTSDIETVRRFLANQFSEMLFAILNVTLASLILFSRSVKLTLVSIALIPLILIASYVFFSKAKKIFLECDLAESSMTTVLQENLNAMRVVKAFHQEQHEIDKFEEANDAYRKKYFDLMHALALFWSGTDFLGQMQILVMIVFGIGMALQGELSVGTFFVFVMYESTIVWPLRQLEGFCPILVRSAFPSHESRRCCRRRQRIWRAGCGRISAEISASIMLASVMRMEPAYAA